MTPRESFLASGKADAFKKIVGTEAFAVACEYALLHFAHGLPPSVIPNLPTDPYVAMDANSQLWGARQVLEILQTIADPIKDTKPTERKTLTYARSSNIGGPS